MLLYILELYLYWNFTASTSFRENLIIDNFRYQESIFTFFYSNLINNILFSWIKLQNLDTKFPSQRIEQINVSMYARREISRLKNLFLNPRIHEREEYTISSRNIIQIFGFNKR